MDLKIFLNIVMYGTLLHRVLVMSFAWLNKLNNVCLSVDPRTTVSTTGQELTVERFIPNDAYVDEGCRIAVITGANGSGKSVYLKQVCLPFDSPYRARAM